MQGERPRHLLLAALRERIGSVLLATQSFWEGVDVPGEALSLVVIDKIPFAVPDDPLTAARIDRIRDDGRRSVRRLPAAARGAGAEAGLRPPHPHAAPTAASSPSSTGASRARAYGATLLASLPPDCPRTELLEDVAAFWDARAARPRRPARGRRRRSP